MSATLVLGLLIQGQPDNCLGPVNRILAPGGVIVEGRFQDSWSDNKESDLCGDATAAAVAFPKSIRRLNAVVLGRLHVHGGAVHPDLASPVGWEAAHLLGQRVPDRAQAGRDVDDFGVGRGVQQRHERRRHHRHAGQVYAAQVVVRLAKGRQGIRLRRAQNAGIIDQHCSSMGQLFVCSL